MACARGARQGRRDATATNVQSSTFCAANLPRATKRRRWEVHGVDYSTVHRIEDSFDMLDNAQRTVFHRT